MRLLSFLVLLIVLAAIAVFAAQNLDNIPLYYFEWTASWPLALVVGVVYLVGMLSGWPVMHLLKSSFQGATESRRR